MTIAVMFTVFAAPALAQSKECNDENKAAWYDTFLKNFRGDPPQQKIAYDAAKLYLTSCPEDPADAQAAYMKNKFVVPYEKLKGDADVAKQLEGAITSKNYAEQMRLGKLVLVNSPDNTAVYIIMGMAGLSEPSVLGESAQYAKKAIEMIEAGKPATPYTRDQALAYLNWDLAKANLKPAPADAITNLLNAAKFDSDLKKNPLLYLDLATAYNDGPRAKLTDEYKAKYTVESPESKLALANINQFIDRQIDAMARAAALATTAADKKAVMDALTDVYKDRNNNKSDGLSELVAGILSKPLPGFPTPITLLPTTTPVSTPTTPAGTNGATSSTTSNVAKPGPSPTPANKKPRRSNHSRG